MKRVHLSLATFILALVSACGGLSSKQRTAAEEALQALKKVEAATQVGVNFQNYGLLVIDAKAKVNEASSALPNGELKQELKAAMEDYGDAAAGWSAEIQHDVFSADSDLGKKLVKKYGVNVRSYSKSANYIDKEDMLNKVWGGASSHVERASSLLAN